MAEVEERFFCYPLPKDPQNDFAAKATHAASCTMQSIGQSSTHFGVL
jgi:hypothetical protein